MKKTLFLLVSLLAACSALCFAGCDTHSDSGEVNENPQSGIVTLDENEDDEGCPDGGCEERRMPKVRFEHRRGKPVGRPSRVK